MAVAALFGNWKPAVETDQSDLADLSRTTGPHFGLAQQLAIRAGTRRGAGGRANDAA
jgi:hypothetical protein